MALTVVSKPSGFQPVGGGSLLYVFSEASIAGKPNYRVELQFDSYISLLPVFEFRPDASLVISCDIAPILRKLLALSFTTSDRLKNTYVKYQAVWDGGSDAQFNLSGDVIYFYTGNAIGYEKRTVYAMTAAGDKPVLLPGVNGVGATWVDYPVVKAWRGRSMNYDFLHDGSLSANSYVIQQMNSVSLYARRRIATFNGSAIALESNSFKPWSEDVVAVGDYDPFSAINNSDSSNLVKFYKGNTAQLGAAGDRIAQVFVGNDQPGLVVLKIGKVGNPTGDITLKYYNTAALVPTTEVAPHASRTLTNLGAVLPDDGTTIDLQVTLDNVGNLSSALHYGLVLIIDSDATKTDANNYYTIFTSSANVYAFGTIYKWDGAAWTSDANKDLFFTLDDGTGSEYLYSSIKLSFQEELQNGVYLKWLNDLGGISTFLFDFNQALSIDAQQLGRYPTLVLYARGLTLTEWYLLADLCQQGVLYNDNLKAGQVVYDITDESNALPVVIKDATPVTSTRKLQHLIQLVARYRMLPNTMQ